MVKGWKVVGWFQYRRGVLERRSGKVTAWRTAVSHQCWRINEEEWKESTRIEMWVSEVVELSLVKSRESCSLSCTRHFTEANDVKIHSAGTKILGQQPLFIDPWPRNPPRIAKKRWILLT